MTLAIDINYCDRLRLWLLFSAQPLQLLGHPMNWLNTYAEHNGLPAPCPAPFVLGNHR